MAVGDRGKAVVRPTQASCLALKGVQDMGKC